MDKETKIFGIGYPKTATSSLNEALNYLGVKSIHNDSFFNEKDLIKTIKEELTSFRGFTDAPIYRNFEKLDQAFPGSKFILTIREPEEWWKSWQKHNKLKEKNRELDRAYTYTDEKKDYWLGVYKKHNDQIKNYFKNRQHDLLIIDVTKDTQVWPKLTKFLGIKVAPNIPFPDLNKTAELCVCFFSHSSEKGGGEMSMLNLIDYLLKKNIAVKVILPKTGQLEDELKLRKVEYKIFPYAWWTKTNQDQLPDAINKWYGIEWILKKWQPHVIYTNTSVIFSGALAAGRLNIPHLWHIREFGQEDHKIDYLFDFADTAKVINDSSNHIIFNSQKVAEKYQPYITTDYSVIYNYVDVSLQKLKTVPNTTKVDVIIPFYNDPMTLDCLESIISNKSSVLNQIIVVDDCSPDLDLVERVKTFCKKYSYIKYQRSKQNGGFVKSVNLGMKMSSHDVVLLNTDTIVTNNWVEKLNQVAYQENNIATVTPLSNTASIFSLVTEDQMTEDLDPEYSNQILEKLNTFEYIDIPTAHGFCMYIKRAVLNDIGLFDDKTFGRGNCEENDFSMRAIQAGYRNVLAGKVYVYHKARQSFKEEKQQLLAVNYPKLLKRYPDYRERLIEFNQINPLKDIRQLFLYFKNHPKLLHSKAIVSIAGTIFSKKRQLDAVEAVSNAIKRGIDAHLLIIGPVKNDIEYFEKIKKFVDQNNLTENIHFLGFINNPFTLFKLSQFALMCSENEAFGRVTAEAMLLGRAVIGTNSGGTPELIKDGKTGFLYSPGDIDQLTKLMIKLFTDQSLAKELGSNARSFINTIISEEKYGGAILDTMKKISKQRNSFNSASLLITQVSQSYEDIINHHFSKRLRQIVWEKAIYPRIKLFVGIARKFKNLAGKIKTKISRV